MNARSLITLAVILAVGVWLALSVRSCPWHQVERIFSTPVLAPALAAGTAQGDPTKLANLGLRGTSLGQSPWIEL